MVLAPCRRGTRCFCVDASVEGSVEGRSRASKRAKEGERGRTSEGRQGREGEKKKKGRKGGGKRERGRERGKEETADREGSEASVKSHGKGSDLLAASAMSVRDSTQRTRRIIRELGGHLARPAGSPCSLRSASDISKHQRQISAGHRISNVIIMAVERGESTQAASPLAPGAGP
eukprot:56246-Rhodomonas_salina.2